jgi:membrane protein YqaA with SNARE-associated domain
VIETSAGVVGLFATTLLAGVVSGVVPVINGELALIGAVLLVTDLPTAIALAVLMSIGQMIAKAVLYQAARRAADVGRRGTLSAKIDRARAAAERWRSKPHAITLISSITGLPPFYLVTLVAGAIKLRFHTFLALGLAGRVIRFSAISVGTVAW